MATSTETMLFNIIAKDSQASAAFNRFAKSVDNSSKSVDRNNAALKSQSKASSDAQASMGGLTREILGFGGSTSSSSKSGDTFRKVLLGINLATGILEPALAGVVVASGAMASAFASAGLGMAGVGLVFKQAAGQIQNVQKLQAQAAAGSKTAAVALKTALAAMPPSVRALNTALDAGKKSYQAWATPLEKPVLAPFTRALSLVAPLLKDLSPFTLAAASALSQLEREMERAVKSSGFQQWLAKMLPAVKPAILDIGHILGNVVTGVGGVLAAFSPMATTILGGVAKLTASFAAWGQSLPSHSGFQSLMATFRQETPLAVGVLKNLATILKNVAGDVTGLATPANSKALLQLLTPLSQVLVSLSQNQALVRLLFYMIALRSAAKQLSAPVKAIKGAFDSLTGVAGNIGRLRDGFNSAAAAESSFSGKAGTLGGILAKLAASPWTWAVGAAAVVAALGTVLVRTADQTGFLIAQFAQQDKASGFNVSGYQKLAAQLNTVNDSQSKLAQTVRLSEGPVSLAKNGSAAYSIALGEVTTAQSSAQSSARNLVTGLGVLQASYGITKTQAEQLALKAGVTATQFAASGTAGEKSRQKVLDWANGAGQATVQADLAANGVNGWNNALGRLSTGLLASQGSEVAWKQAEQAATQAIQASTTGLAGNSAAALAARSAVIQSTQAAITFAQSQRGVKGGADVAAAALKSQIGFLQSTHDHSKLVTDEINALRQALEKLQSKSVNINVHGTGQFTVFQAKTGLKGMASGGRITAGTGPTADDVLIRASKDETIVSAADSRLPFMRAAFRKARVPGYAGGGVVGSYSGAPAPGEARWATGDYNATVTLIEKATAGAAAAAMKAAVKAAAGPSSGGGHVNWTPGGGTAQWRPVVLSALSQLGLSSGLVLDVLYQMLTESGGNPNAVNKTDSNWLAGHPSVGLMQVIAGTFRAYAGKYVGTGPFSYGVSVNPMANVYAALNYGKHGRGFGTGPGQIGSGHGYALGGPINEPIAGIGLRSGAGYSFGEGGAREHVVGQADIATLIAEFRGLRADLAKHPAATGRAVSQAIDGMARKVITR